MNSLKDKLYQYRLLVIIVCICLIGGCGYGLYKSFNKKDDSYVTHVKDGDSAVVKTGDVTITKDDLYEYFLDNDGLNMTLNSAINYVADQEITDEDAINSKVEELKQQYLQYAGTSDLETYAKDAGYESEDDFVKQILEPNAKIQLLQGKYVEDNFKSLVKEYKVKYLKYFTVDTESQALKIIKDCTSEESFTNYFNENSGTDAGLVTKESSSVDSKIIKKLDKFTKDGIYAKAIKTSESKYAIVWVYNTDKSNLKDEIKKSLTSISNFSTKCETSYLRKYNFDVYEPSIKKKIKNLLKIILNKVSTLFFFCFKIELWRKRK